MTLSLFISLSLFSLYIFQDTNEKPLYLYGFYLFSALAFLTKGLIGIAFPFGVAITYMCIIERWQGVKKIFNLKAMMLFLVISAPWYIAQFVVNGQEFVDQFFIKHHFKRYLDVISGHRGPFYYYIPVFLIGLFPWSIFLPMGIRNAIKTKEPLFIYTLVWFSFIFVFFSFSTTKLPNYILPLVPAASLLIAAGMSKHTKSWWKYSNLFLAVISLLMAIAFIFSRTYLVKYSIPDTNWIFLLAAITLIMGILSLYSAYKKKSFYIPLSGLMIIFLFLLSIEALPLASDYLQGTLHRYSLYAKTRLQGNQRIIAYGINNPSILFYSGRKIINVGSRDAVKAALINNGDNFIAIANTKSIEDLIDLGFKVIDSDEKYALLERNKMN